MATTPAVLVSGLRKSFGDHEVLRGLEMTVPSGEVFALLGENGAGKTTTLSILATLLKPDAGTAMVAGYDVVREGAKVREAITVTSQTTTIDPVLTGLENLTLIARLRHVPHPKRVAAQLIDQFGLDDAGAKAAGTFSGGMKRRLDIAMSLIGRPTVIFLDEPTAGLDPSGRRDIWAFVESLAAKGTTIVLTTQHMDEAARLASTIALLHGGVIAALGDHRTICEIAGGAPDLETAFLTLTSRKDDE